MGPGYFIVQICERMLIINEMSVKTAYYQIINGIFKAVSWLYFNATYMY